ncbi:hypothetical protein [Algibacter sp. L1A34]|uniref:hypothetical protein n=1 Tax=Algibacter sp. L1A34 TaxID=2686365 RepID=UPI00131D2593|nr:hypothetical protein [Algibacter sp. L1A34]
MNNIIIGNGIDIQFGGFEYTNKSIIERALLYLKTGDYSSEVYTKEIETWIYILYSVVPDFLNGDYDQLAVMKDEKEELDSFKRNYSKNTSISEIGFEYYFLLNELHCRKNKITNPERYYFQEFLRRLFLDSIFNKGKINKLYLKFPTEVTNYIKSYDNIFTTNYDKNVELATGKKVLYLHGAFHVLDPVYDSNSFRNRLSDKPAEKTPIIKGFEHTFSNAITGSSGAFKLFSANQPELANSAIEKFAKGMKENPELSIQMEEWKNSDNDLVKKLYEAVTLKKKEPDLEFSIDYSVNKLKSIKGKITFIGLSPNNDSHIMKIIKENINVDTIEFYYFDKKESIDINLFFNNKKVITENIIELWKRKASA